MLGKQKHSTLFCVSGGKMGKKILLVVFILIVVVMQIACSNQNEKQFAKRREEIQLKMEIVRWYEYCDLYVEEYAKDSFPAEFIDELVVAVQKDSLNTFLENHPADYEILSQEKINSLTTSIPILYSFCEEKEEKYIWYKVPLCGIEDLIVSGKEDNFYFAKYSKYIEKALPIYGEDIFFVSWDQKNIIVATNATGLVYAYYFDGIVPGNVAILKRMDNQNVDIQYYRYETY